MTPAAQTAIREMQAKSTEIHMERARLEGVLAEAEAVFSGAGDRA